MLDKFLYGFFGGLDNLCAGVANYLYKISRGKNDRKNKQTNIRASKRNTKKNKQISLIKNLKKEVNIGANGTQNYIIKKGINKGKML